MRKILCHAVYNANEASGATAWLARHLKENTLGRKATAGNGHDAAMGRRELAARRRKHGEAGDTIYAERVSALS
jgi:hypothetical protein